MLILCSICHIYYDGIREFAFCPHRTMNIPVTPVDYCDIHKLVPSQYSGEVCPLCTAEKRKKTVGKSIRFTSGFYQGERGIILHYRGHSAIAGHSYEIVLRNGVRVITTDRHFRIDSKRDARREKIYWNTNW